MNDGTNRETTMTATNAAKKLTKAGFRKAAAERFAETWAIDDRAIELNLTNSEGTMGPDIVQNTVWSVRVKRLSERDDLMTDYYAGSWMPNLTRAIDYTLARLGQPQM